MYVEFFGIPGAGKTTVAEQTGELLVHEGISCATRQSPGFAADGSKLWWGIRHLGYADLAGTALLVRLSFKNRWGIKKLLTRSYEYQKLCYALSRSGDGELVVWDGGLVQFFANLAVLGLRDEERVADFIHRRIPPRALIVGLRVAFEEAEQRRHGREPGLVASRDTHDYLARSMRAQERIAECLARKGVEVLELDGGRSPAENAAVVVQKVREALHL